MKLLLALIMLFMCANLNADCSNRVSEAKSIKKFYRAVARRDRPLTVVLFYDRCQQCHGGYDIKGLMRLVSMVSNTLQYREGDLQFVKVNVDRNDLAQLQHDLSIYDLPTFVLFQDGVPVTDESGNVAQLYGAVDSEQLRDFINSYLGDSLQDRIDYKEEVRQRKAEAAAYYWNTYPWWAGCGGCWSGCYPYYGCGWGGWYGGCAPRASFGFGFCL